MHELTEDLLLAGELQLRQVQFPAFVILFSGWEEETVLCFQFPECKRIKCPYMHWMPDMESEADQGTSEEEEEREEDTPAQTFTPCGIRQEQDNSASNTMNMCGR